jgi:hypothetical protein
MNIAKDKIEIILNKSLTYFLPMVDAQVQFKYLHLLRNSYLNNGDVEEFCVLYEWSANPQYTAWEKELMENHLYVGHEDYDNLVLYKFRLSKNMKDAKTLFINGKYSMFSDEHKTAIDSFLKRKGASNREKIMKILNRDEGLRLKMNQALKVKIDPNNELSSKPDLNNEDFSNFCSKTTFKIEQFLNEEDNDGKES